MTAAQIDEPPAMPISTVSAVLLRIGLWKRSRLEPLKPLYCYEHKRPGELVHIYVKKLARIYNVGHRITGNRRDQRPRVIARRKQTGLGVRPRRVDDSISRVPTSRRSPTTRACTVACFLRRAVAFYVTYGIRVERVMTDNGTAIAPSTHALTCRALGLRHLRTRPYCPRTNGKASASSARCSDAGPTALSSAA